MPACLCLLLSLTIFSSLLLLHAAYRYALRVMTSAVVLYDRVSTTGVFIRSASVQTRKCLRTLHKAQGKKTPYMMRLFSFIFSWTHLSCTTTILHNTGIGTSPSSSLAQQLLNSVKYSTIHFKDGNTPGYVRTYLGD